MNNPSLSVVMPNYNHAHYLRETLTSILKQSVRPDEFIVVDDGSTDDSVTILQEYVKQDQLVQLVCNEKNRGGNFSVKKGLSLCSGDYIYIPSVDDRILSGFFEKEMSLLSQYPHAGLCMSDFSCWNMEKGEKISKRHRLSDEPCYFSPNELARLIKGDHIAGITAILKRSAVLEAGGFLESLKWYCDWFTNLVVGFRYGVCYIPEELGTIRVLSESYSAAGRRDPDQQQQLFRRLLTMLKTTDYQDVFPYFVRSKAMNHFGDEIVRAVLKSPEHWDIPTLMLIYYPFWEWSQRIQSGTICASKLDQYCMYEKNVESAIGCSDPAIARASMSASVPLCIGLLRQHPEQVETHLALACVHAALGDDRRVEETLGMAISRFPANIDVRYALAMTYARKGQIEAAIHILEEIMSMDSSHLRAQEKLKSLNEGGRHKAQTCSISNKAAQSSKQAIHQALVRVGDSGPNRRPKFSIVTPTYNCASLIRDCIESVLRQNYKDFEHIIVDGGSTDNTIEILKEYSHVKWISEPDNGEIEALNKALRMASGDCIGWLNADDCYVDGALTRVAEEFDVGDGRHLVYGKTIFVNDEKEPTHWVMPAAPINMVTLTRWFRLNLFQPSIFFSRELVEDVGLFSEHLCYGADYQYWFRIALKGYSFHFVNQVFSKAMIYRAGGKTEAPYSVKAKEWWEICMAFLPCLEVGEQIHFFKEYYNFRLLHANDYYKGDDFVFPNSTEGLTGFMLAYRECKPIDPKLFYKILSSRPQNSLQNTLFINANLLGQYGETLFQHGQPAEASKAFDWALALESRDQKILQKFGVAQSSIAQTS